MPLLFALPPTINAAQTKKVVFTGLIKSSKTLAFNQAHLPPPKPAIAPPKAKLIALLWKIPEPLQDDSLWTDKIVHLLIFMILAISYLNVGTQGFKSFKFANFGKALGAAALFSILTEALQFLVPWRHGDFMDLAANILGVGLAGIMVKTMHSVKKTV